MEKHKIFQKIKIFYQTLSLRFSTSWKTDLSLASISFFLLFFFWMKNWTINLIIMKLSWNGFLFIKFNTYYKRMTNFIYFISLVGKSKFSQILLKWSCCKRNYWVSSLIAFFSYLVAVCDNCPKLFW